MLCKAFFKCRPWESNSNPWTFKPVCRTPTPERHYFCQCSLRWQFEQITSHFAISIRSLSIDQFLWTAIEIGKTFADGSLWWKSRVAGWLSPHLEQQYFTFNSKNHRWRSCLFFFFFSVKSRKWSFWYLRLYSRFWDKFLYAMPYESIGQTIYPRKNRCVRNWTRKALALETNRRTHRLHTYVDSRLIPMGVGNSSDKPTLNCQRTAFTASLDRFVQP